jgi:hypothetical protein
MTFATGKELKQVEDVLDVCTMGLAVKVDTVPSQSGAHDVLVLTMLNVLEEIDPEMREIEELRRLLIEAQS